MPLKKKKKASSKIKKITAKKAAKKKILRKPAKKKAIKKALKKAPKKKLTAKKPAVKKRKEKIIGIITHYFPKVRAAVIKLKASLANGDTINIKGHTTDFKQKISSMQIDHVPIGKGKKGDEIGLLVDSRVRQHDVVIKA